VAQTDLHPRTALIVLTALNLLNYADRNVLFAVQPLVQEEFHISKVQIGYLTSAFLLCYMCAAPFVGPLADRYSRKLIIVVGAMFWSGLTLLTAVTHNYTELLVRHTLVGIGEATFVTIAPTFVVDLFSEDRRARILGVFYLAIPVGSAAGYLLGGNLAPHYGWRFPFYIAAAPGFLLAGALLFLTEPERGQFDSPKDHGQNSANDPISPRRGAVLGLLRNPAFLTATLGMAFMAEIARLNGGSESNLEPAFKALRDLLPNVGAISANLGAHATLFQQEQIDIAPYNFNFVETLKAKGVDVEFVVPDSGPVAWRTSLHIVKGAARPDLAFQWIEGAITPEVQGDESKPPYDIIPTNTKVAMTPVMTAKIAKTPADLSKLIFLDWKKLNEVRGSAIDRFNREIKV